MEGLQAQFKGIINRLRSNSIIGFFVSHLLILVVALLVCALGFQQALVIVRQDILDSTDFAMEQGVVSLEDTLTSLRTLGMQLSYSSSMRILGSTTREDAEYPLAAMRAIDEYGERLLYYPGGWTKNCAVYMDKIDRFIYLESLYRPEVFEKYLDDWQMSQTDWDAVRYTDTIWPFFYANDADSFYYLVPCTGNVLVSRYGLFCCNIKKDELMSHMSFLDEFDSYCFMVLDSTGQVLYERNDLGVSPVAEGWTAERGVWNSGEYLVLSRAGAETDLGLSYLLVLPKQTAMHKLTLLRNETILLALAATLLCGIAAAFFSMRSGKPVNAMARSLSREGAPVAGLEHISSAVAQLLQDNAHLLAEQEKDLPALQKTFFHNLLKSEFVSRAEMEYMSERAGIELTEKTYCAATLRLFPGVDADAIDGQTVEDARVLQPVISAYIDKVCARPVWSYKRHTLETLYIFEIKDQQALVRVLQNTAMWLRDEYHVDACWGLGTPCDDLMQFWKSSEEAGAALLDRSSDALVQLYDCSLAAKDPYYFPYSVEERLTQGLRSGDGQVVEDILGLLQQENFVRRSLNRSQLQRLHQRIVEILSAQLAADEPLPAEFDRLESLVQSYRGDCVPYFEALNELCGQLCERTAQQKTARRRENVKAIETYLIQHYRDPDLGLAKVSSAFDLSEGYLSAIFKKEVGTNFSEYLEQLRINAARVLLEDGVRVAELPERVGYNSIQSFRRAFKRVMGVSPAEYRESLTKRVNQ